MARAFIFIFHKCTPNLKNDIKAAVTFPAIRVAQDPIMLLKVIQSLCCSYNAKTQSVMATVASRNYQEFSARVETPETYGGIGAIGITPTFLTAKLKELTAAGKFPAPRLPLMPNVWPPSNWFVTKFSAVS